MKKYSANLHISVKSKEENLSIQTGIEYVAYLPSLVREMLSDLMAKLPILIRAGWLVIVDKYPDTEGGFEVTLSFDFEKDEDDEWYVSSHIDDSEKVDCMILGMSKMIFQEDPIVDEIIEKELEKSDLPEYVQHFDPNC